MAGPVVSYLIMTDEAFKAYAPLNFYKAKGFVQTYAGVDELAQGLGVNKDNLVRSLEEYNKCYDNREECKEQFGKTEFPTPFRLDRTFHVMTITPSIHYTMGGLRIDANARVLGGGEEKPLEGLFAAGEVTGGVHGANRLAGNSLLECVVFGRIAGKNAAAAAAAQ